MADGPALPGSYEPFRPSMRTPHKMQPPWCMICNKAADGWLFHKTGHIDDTPLIIFRCHGKMIVEGCTPDLAEEFRNRFVADFLSGNVVLTLQKDGKLNFSLRELVTAPVTPATIPKDLLDL